MLLSKQTKHPAFLTHTKPVLKSHRRNVMKKKVFISAVFILMAALSACSSISLPLSTASATPAASSTQSAITTTLGAGILKLEGSAQAITASQASNLLFLWKGVKVLTADQTSSKIELAALYTQIEDALTAEQKQAIEQLNFSQSDLMALQQTLGATQVKFNASSSSTSSSTKSSSSSSSQANFGGGPGGGGPGGGSDIQNVINGSSSSSGVPSTTSSTTSATKSSSSTAKSAAKISVDYNALFADSVIALLQQRVSA
jgi:hypothetical protein